MTGRPLHVLFVCAMNKRRSATAEQMYRNDARLTVRSAGVRTEARRRVSEGDLAWAAIVFVMEREHRTVLRERYSHVELPPVVILDIPDDFEYMAAELQAILRLNVDAELDLVFAARPENG